MTIRRPGTAGPIALMMQQYSWAKQRRLMKSGHDRWRRRRRAKRSSAACLRRCGSIECRSLRDARPDNVRPAHTRRTQAPRQTGSARAIPPGMFGFFPRGRLCRLPAGIVVGTVLSYSPHRGCLGSVGYDSRAGHCRWLIRFRRTVRQARPRSLPFVVAGRRASPGPADGRPPRHAVTRPDASGPDLHPLTVTLTPLMSPRTCIVWSVGDLWVR